MPACSGFGKRSTVWTTPRSACSSISPRAPTGPPLVASRYRRLVGPLSALYIDAFLLQNLHLVIQRHGEGDERLPSSHTCFNHLLLPLYSSKDALQRKLVQALDYATG